MPNDVSLGQHFEDFIRDRVSSGRYRDASDVIRDALRLMERRERDEVIEASIRSGLADIEAGRVFDADEVFDELLAEVSAMKSQS